MQWWWFKSYCGIESVQGKSENLSLVLKNKQKIYKEEKRVIPVFCESVTLAQSIVDEAAEKGQAEEQRRGGCD